MYRALQLSSPELPAGSFAKQELAALRSDFDREAALSEPRVNVPLEFENLPIENRRERRVVQRLIRDHCVNAIYKLRREFPPNRGKRDILELAADIRRQSFSLCLKTEIRLELSHNLSRAEIAREKDNRLFKVDGRVITQ